MKWLMAGKKCGRGRSEVRAGHEGRMETTRRNERALERRMALISPAASPGFLQVVMKISCRCEKNQLYCFILLV